MKKDDPYHDLSMYKGAPPENFRKAQRLRKNMTESELIVWEELKNNKRGVKFRRQHPIHIYIVDFYCHELKLILEIDGAYHTTENQKRLDAEREELLKFQDLDLAILRFTNAEVKQNLKKVVQIIDNKIQSFK